VGGPQWADEKSALPGWCAAGWRERGSCALRDQDSGAIGGQLQ